jgi:3-hydroxy-9,10-secoandrosta-1,3,5(10)-triene-9,17-dione monooxygenase reductase component
MTPPVSDSREFRSALGMFATGVTVVATLTRDGFHATTANSFTSLSLDPRLVLVCLNTASRTLSAIAETGVFSVSVLSEFQEDVSQRFADRDRPAGTEAFRGIRISLDGHGCPRLDESLASFGCKVHALHEGGDHVIVVGEVVEMSVRSAGDPLVFHEGAYRRLLARDYLDQWAS